MNNTKVTYKSYNQDEYPLFSVTLGELVKENHPARILNAVIDRIDISDVESTYKGGGTSSYNPRMLLKVIVYGYLQNIYSGRHLARQLEENVVYMWLSGQNKPDFRTINRFRSERLCDGRFTRIFTRVVELLNSEGLLSLERQYIDGTKIESASNRYTFVWRKATETNKSKLQSKVSAVLRQANEVLEEENASEAEPELTPEEVAEKSDALLRRMDEQGISDRKLRKSVGKLRSEAAPKLQEYEDRLAILGERNSYSKTDHGATFMRMKEDAMNNGQTKPGYNVQIATDRQYITNYQIFWRPTDYGTLIPFLESFKERYGIQPKEVIADSGYGNEQNYEYLAANGIEAFVKYPLFHAELKRKYLKNPFLPEHLYYNADEDYFVCPMGQHMTYVRDKERTSELGYRSTSKLYRARNCSRCPLRGMCFKGSGDRTIEVNVRSRQHRDKAKVLLTSERGLYHRSMRPIEPEAVFGDIKFNHGFKRFRLRSNRKVEVEFGLVALAHNLRKYISSTLKPAKSKAEEAAFDIEYRTGSSPEAA